MKTPSPVKSMLNLFRGGGGERRSNKNAGKRAMRNAEQDVVVAAEVIQVESVDHLENELVDIIECLSQDGRKRDWEDRMQAMLRLEGLVLGGAGSYRVLESESQVLCLALEDQLTDRRSVVAKQACHLISVMMQYCGYEMHGLAQGIQPALLKLLGISIAVVAQAASSCLESIYNYCHDGRLLPQLCTTLCSDRNTKIRTGAARVFLVVIECWENEIIEQYRVDIEQTMLSILQDASAEARQRAREAFELYYARFWDDARRIVDSLDSREHKLRDRLIEAMEHAAEYYGNVDEGNDDTVDLDVNGDVKAVVTVVQHDSPKVQTASKLAGRMSKAQRVVSRKSEAFRPVEDFESRLAPKSALKTLPGGAVRVATVQKPARPAENRIAFDDIGDINLHDCIRKLQGRGIYWNDKVECLRDMDVVFRSMEDNVGFCPEDIDVYCDVISDEIGDAHLKVASQAIRTLISSMQNPFSGPSVEHSLEKIVPTLFLRATDSKEAIRDVSFEALETVRVTYKGDAVAQSLVAATRSCKSAKAQCAVMAYFEQIFNPRLTESGNSWRTMLSYCLRMATNKNPDVRQHAISACATVYHMGKSSAVEAALSGIPASPRVTVGRAIREFTVKQSVLDKAAVESGQVSEDEEDAGENEEDLPEADCLDTECEASDTMIEVEDDQMMSKEEQGTLPQEDEEELEYPGPEADTVVLLSVSEILEVASQLQLNPSKSSFESLNKFNSENISFLPDDQRATVGVAIWDAFITVLSDSESNHELLLAACSCVISFNDMMPENKIEPQIDNVSKYLIQLSGSTDYELSLLAEACAVQLIKMVDGADGYSCTVGFLPDPDSLPPFQGKDARECCCVLKMLQACLNKVSGSQLKVALDSSMPSLCRCFESPHAKIRKLSMDCILSIQKVVGPEHTHQYTQTLTNAQQELIQISFEKLTGSL